MTDPLTHIVFTPELLATNSVQGFDGGPAPWEDEITRWLKAPPGQVGACEDVLTGNSEVWLYATKADGLVGVGAVAPSAASWPKNSDPRQPATCITWLGVDVRFRGKKYGKGILEHLLWVSQSRAAAYPLVTLFVHTGNAATRDWYGRYGFQPVGGERVIDGHPRQRMTLKL